MTIPVIRPEIMAYAAMMERIMREHDPKLGESWKTIQKKEVFAALANAIQSLEKSFKSRAIDKTVEQCLDVANFTMMLAWHYHHFGKEAADGLTPKQNNTITFIRSFIAEHGHSPTYREIAKALGVQMSTIQDNMQTLKRRGVLTVEHRQSRSIRLLELPPREKAQKSKRFRAF